MYCKKCGLEIQEGAETVCPLCNMPLEERPAEQPAAAPDESAEDLKLRDLISDIEGSVKQSLGADEKSAQRNGPEVLFDPKNAIEEELQVTSEPGSAAASQAAFGSDSDYEKTRAAMEQALASIEQNHLPAEPPPRRSAVKNAAAVVLVIAVVAAGIAAGYLFSVKEPQPRAPAVTAKKTPSQVPIAATPPDMTRPGIPEKPVTEESKPPAPPAAQPAEPVQEQPAVAGAPPAQQEPEAPAAAPVKTADEQPPAVQSVPESPPPAAEQKAYGPPPQPSAPLETSRAATVVYCVNVGSFKMKESTEGVCRDLKKNGYEPAIETVTLSDGNTWYRVTVGSFATRTEAAQFGKELESKTNIKPFVVKRKLSM